MNEELQKLFEGSELSDDFKKSVTKLFEDAVAEEVQKKTETIEEQLEEKYSQKAEEYSKYIISEMEDKTYAYIQTEILPVVEKYIDYATAEFLKENESKVIDSIKVESADQFLQGFGKLVEGYNVQIPEGQQNIVEKLEKEKVELQKRFDSTLDENKQLKEEIDLNKKSTIIDEIAKDLTESQKEKFLSAVSTVSYKSDDQFKTAVSDLYESYFPSKGKEDKEQINEHTEEPADKTIVENQDKWLSNLFSKV